MKPERALVETWVLRNGRVCAEGDSAEISALLKGSLVHVAYADGGWRSLYQHRGTNRFWELTYPNSHMHGGGPRRLRELELAHAEEWV
ncbi:Imm27 family immunity protein [Terrihabitans rhizophilus]|uniref:Imm27 family immunity protein n=1 Tax=Terrihabitans rhizophilus TaxID=3092662 RepID=UPI003CC6DC20